MVRYRAPFRPRPGDPGSVVALKIACFVIALAVAGSAYWLIWLLLTGPR